MTTLPSSSLQSLKEELATFRPASPLPVLPFVGAGISGLVAATELLRAGVSNITLFEARDRIGGRICPKHLIQSKAGNDPSRDTGLYLAGCGCSFTGGWIEGSVQTAANSACAMIRSTGAKLLPGNPLDEVRSVYRY
ncbi:FAD-dependent oxidoreductase [Paraburkholderia sabiae]|uniref:FAD-dependent oxidoreductase n=2 Tax=Paraburkholderia sabiae TaxID=273251 RepID=A0ABU9QRP7_9BURK|nr:FAD-dependent oxidoreductase [Paraburkholderia sabiae]WJZ79459.1 FAD-dependent oxidoreductase [Paraburkholderia sabiae]